MAPHLASHRHTTDCGQGPRGHRRNAHASLSALLACSAAPSTAGARPAAQTRASAPTAARRAAATAPWPIQRRAYPPQPRVPCAVRASPGDSPPLRQPRALSAAPPLGTTFQQQVMGSLPWHEGVWVPPPPQYSHPHPPLTPPVQAQGAAWPLAPRVNAAASTASVATERPTALPDATPWSAVPAAAAHVRDGLRSGPAAAPDNHRPPAATLLLRSPHCPLALSFCKHEPLPEATEPLPPWLQPPLAPLCGST